MIIKINGQDETPIYNFGTLRRIGEITKQDPFTLQIDYTKPAEIYKYVQVIVHAGLQSAKVKATVQQVQEVIDEWSLAEAIEVITEFNKAFVVEPKEGEENGAHGAALMAAN